MSTLRRDWMLLGAVGICVTSVLAFCLLRLPPLQRLIGYERAHGSGYRSGDKIDDVDRVAFVRSDRNMVLFARSTCGACQQAVDHLRGLVAEASLNAFRPILVVPELTELELEFADKIGVDRTSVFVATTSRVGTVPAILMASSSGRVVFVAQGSTAADAVRDCVAFMRRAVSAG